MNPTFMAILRAVQGVSADPAEQDKAVARVRDIVAGSGETKTDPMPERLEGGGRDRMARRGRDRAEE